MKSVIFSAQEVRATLDGSKTQFRRIVKFQFPPPNMPHPEMYLGRGCPFGQIGDRLFVKEVWVELLHTSPATGEPMLCDGDKLIEPATFWVDKQGKKRWRYDGKVIAYRATSEVEFCDGDGFCGEFADKDDFPRWKSPVTMPKWASRLTLEITDIRVQRLQEISEEDAIAEECPCYVCGKVLNGLSEDDCHCFHRKTTLSDFKNQWESIHDKGSWDRNDFVWAVSYKRVV